MDLNGNDHQFRARSVMKGGINLNLSNIGNYSSE
jgi:hypothetical protein